MTDKNNKLSAANVFHIAKLANIPLNDKEAIKIAKGLSETLEFIDKVKRVNTTGVEATSQVTGLENVLREDEIQPSLSQKEALSGTTSTYKGYFKIKAILEE